MPKYRVIKKAFVNGSLHDVGAIIEAPPGMAGAGLKLIDGDDSAIALPSSPPPSGDDQDVPVVGGPDPNTPPPSQAGKGKK